MASESVVAEPKGADIFAPLLAELKRLNDLLAAANMATLPGSQIAADNAPGERNDKGKGLAVESSQANLFIHLQDQHNMSYWILKLIQDNRYRLMRIGMSPRSIQYKLAYHSPPAILEVSSYEFLHCPHTESLGRKFPMDHGSPYNPRCSIVDEYTRVCSACLGSKEFPEGEAGLYEHEKDLALFWWGPKLFNWPDSMVSLYQTSYDDDDRTIWRLSQTDPDSLVTKPICDRIPEFRAYRQRNENSGMLRTVYGKIWSISMANIPPARPIMPLDVLVFLTCITELAPWKDHLDRGPLLGVTYASCWPNIRSFFTPVYEHLYCNGVQAQYQLRYLIVAKMDAEAASSELNSEWEPGRCGSIEISRFLYLENTPFLFQDSVLGLREMRSAISLNTMFDSERPVFSIVSLYDDDTFFPYSEQKFKSPLDFESRGKTAGFVLFQNILLQHLEFWRSRWIEVMQTMDEIVDVELKDVIRKPWIDKYMFDSGFTASARYFSVLQLLRICSNWISETSSDIDDLVLQSSPVLHHLKDLKGEDRTIIDKNFEVLVRKKDNHVNKLLERVQTKMAEIESLRSGIFNATALQEAMKSSKQSAISTAQAAESFKMNSYLFVFTMMTVLYLPLSFVTSLFGMHLFDKEDPSTNQTTFYVTFALAAIITYLAAFIALLVVKRQSKDKLDEILEKERWGEGEGERS